MALSTLSLSVTTGVRDRRFKSKIVGRTPGSIITVLNGTQGFSEANGFILHRALPADPVVRILERDPVTSEQKTTYISLVAYTAYQVSQQASSGLAGGRTMGRYVVQPRETGDGSLQWMAYVTDDLGSTAGVVLASGPTLSLVNLVNFTTATASGTKVADITGVPAGQTPTLSPNDARLVIGGSEGAGWTVLRGMAAVVAGDLTFTVSATGALSAGATVTVTTMVGGPLAISGARAYTDTTAAGATVFNIDNVPSGVTPTLSPNDGRVIVAGSEGAWKGVRGSAAASPGRTYYTASATGVARSQPTGVKVSTSVAPVVTAFAYEAEAQAIFNAFTVTPTVRRKQTINNAVKLLKATGIWPKLLGFGMTMEADVTGRAINWKSPGTLLATIGTPTYVADDSMVGVLRTGIYLDQMSASGAYIGVHGRIAGTDSAAMAGATNAAVNGLRLYRSTGTGTIMNMGAQLAGVLSSADTTGLGWYAHGRVSSAGFSRYRGPVVKGTTVQAGVTITDHIEIYVGGMNNNGTAAANSLSHGIWAIGNGLTDADNKALASLSQTLADFLIEGEPLMYESGIGAAAVTYDLVIYGCTSMAYSAAYQAKRLGLNVAVVGGWRDTPASMFGMSATGLGATDVNNAASLGGLPKYIWDRIKTLKGSQSANFQPKFARRTFRELLDPRMATGVDIPTYFSGGVLDAAKSGARITSFTTLDGRVVNASYFLDASFEGDLAAATGLSITKTREAAATSGVEALNGNRRLATTGGALGSQGNNHAGTFVKINPYIDGVNASSGLLPIINDVMTTTYPVQGAPDDGVQSYNFRLTCCSTASQKTAIIPFSPTPPPGYDKLMYEHLGRLFATDPTMTLTDVLIQNTIGTAVYDINANGAYSTDLMGGSTGYIESAPAQRELIWKKHWNHILGLFYYLQYEDDARVPSSLRTAMGILGFHLEHNTQAHPNDDYNTSPQMYIREGWRLISDQVFDATMWSQPAGSTFAYTSIACASYNFDSHPSKAYAVDIDGTGAYIWAEGAISASGNNLQALPLEAYVPKLSECENLGTCFSGSFTRIAFSSPRMEFTLMAVAQAMAVVVARAKAEGGIPLQSINRSAFRSALMATPTLTGEVVPVAPLTN